MVLRGHFSIVRAEELCLVQLAALDLPWRYALNLGGSDQMLYTNLQLVRLLARPGPPRPHVESFPLPGQHRSRVETKFQLDPVAAREFDPDHGELHIISHF